MLKKIARRIRKGFRDAGSFIGDNPAVGLAAAAFGIPTLLDKFGGTGGFNILDMISKGIGSFDKIQNKRGPGRILEGSGLLGTAQDIAQSLTGKDKAGIGLGILNSILMKNELEKQRADELRKEKEIREQMMRVSNKFDSTLGGTPFVDEQIRGTLYNPEDQRTYDYYDYDTGTYKNFQSDAEGRRLPLAEGGIAKLAMGGNPNRMTFNLPVRRAMGGGTGVPGLTADMSSNQMMNKIEDNPGITAFFPRRLGMIDGPGGPKDDKIPAMLSDGEFVFTAKAVDNAGGPKAMYNMMNKLDPESSKGRGII
jgi:hypothetical protein|tara:strand:- start:576 stop:1502 length:927 start_codon:yes stop_codon:yes gene_type:complete